MRYTVAKPFHTATRRFKPGAVITAADIEAGPLRLADLCAGGFLVSGDAPPAQAAQPPEPEPIAEE
jgi:hypothetical protein